MKAVNSVGDIVQTPIVIEKNDFTIRPEGSLGVTIDIIPEGGAIRSEIPLEPAEYFGKFCFLRSDPIADRIVNEGSHGQFQLEVQVFRGISPVGQRRAGYRSTINGGMDPRVVEILPENAVLNLVQVIFPALDLNELNVPYGIDEGNSAFDVFYTFHRVMVQDQSYREGIVSIDPINHLFGPRPIGIVRVCRRKDGEVAVELGAILLETVVIDPSISYVFLQKLIPDLMAYRAFFDKRGLS